MALASESHITLLEQQITEAATGLKQVKAKKMFGCHALFANDAVFGLVWKEGRLGVRLTDEDSFDNLMSLKGSSPWSVGKMTISHWVLLPRTISSSALKQWVTAAHFQALSSGGKKKKKKTKSKKKKTSPARKNKK